MGTATTGIIPLAIEPYGLDRKRVGRAKNWLQEVTANFSRNIDDLCRRRGRLGIGPGSHFTACWTPAGRRRDWWCVHADAAILGRDSPSEGAWGACVIQSAGGHGGNSRLLPDRVCLGRRRRMAVDAGAGRRTWHLAGHRHVVLAGDAAMAGRHGYTEKARAALLQLRGHDANIKAELALLRWACVTVSTTLRHGASRRASLMTLSPLSGPRPQSATSTTSRPTTMPMFGTSGIRLSGKTTTPGVTSAGKRCSLTSAFSTFCMLRRTDTLSTFRLQLPYKPL